MSLRSYAVALALLISGLSYAAGRSPAPPSFDSLDALEKWVESRKGFGYPESVLSKLHGQRIYIVWNSPFSGRAATYAHAYRRDSSTGRWTLLDSRLIEHPEPVSYAYVDGNAQKIVYVGASGRTLKEVRLPPRGGLDD